MRQVPGWRVRAWTLRLAVVGAVALTVAAVPMVGGIGQGRAPDVAAAQPKAVAPVSVSPARPESIVVFGDSVPTSAGCSCTPFGELLTATATRDSGIAAAQSSYAQDGLTSTGLLAQLRTADPTMLASLRTATLVVVVIGANDFDESRAADKACGGLANIDCYAPSLSELSANLRGIFGDLHQLSGPGATVVAAGYWNVFLDGRMGQAKGQTYVATSDALTRSVNTAIETSGAQVGGRYADLYSAFKNEGDDTSLLASDGDHPGKTGHAVIATTVARVAGI